MRVHDSQAYSKMDVTRERISRILELREILLSIQTGFSLVNAAVVCAILESISGLEPSSVITEPRYLIQNTWYQHVVIIQCLFSLQGGAPSQMYSRQNNSQTHRILQAGGGGECPKVLIKQQVQDHAEETFKEESAFEKQMEGQNADQTTQHQFVSEGAYRQCTYSESGFHHPKESSFSQRQKEGEVAKQPGEQKALPTSPPLPSRPVGRGRPRKYPDIPLVCVVCGKKLSSRMSVLNHMTTQHPTAELPAALAPLAALSAAKAQSSAKRGRKRKMAQRGAQVNTLSDSALEGDSGVEGSREDGASSVERLKKRKAELESLVCETCGMTFEHRQQMYRHRRLCTWKVCHLCGKSVKLLDMHLKRHNAPRRFSCPHCPKTFLFHNYLTQHMLYHNGERPFCCEICGMRYHERTRLNAHLRTHTGSKPFKCNQCDAAFTRPRGLNDHKRVHTGEKPYGCQVCGRKFSSTGNLAAHRRKVHRMEPLSPNRMTRKLYIEPNAGDSGSIADVSVGGHPT